MSRLKIVLGRISYGAGPLATSSLAVGRFAAKQGSLCSPRGRLVASLFLLLRDDTKNGCVADYAAPITKVLVQCEQIFGP